MGETVSRKKIRALERFRLQNLLLKKFGEEGLLVFKSIGKKSSVEEIRKKTGVESEKVEEIIAFLKDKEAVETTGEKEGGIQLSKREEKEENKPEERGVKDEKEGKENAGEEDSGVKISLLDEMESQKEDGQKTGESLSTEEERAEEQKEESISSKEESKTEQEQKEGEFQQEFSPISEDESSVELVEDEGEREQPEEELMFVEDSPEEGELEEENSDNLDEESGIEMGDFSEEEEEEIQEEEPEETAEDKIRKKFGEVGVAVYHLIDGQRSVRQIMEETGLTEKKLVEILNWMEDEGIINLGGSTTRETKKGKLADEVKSEGFEPMADKEDAEEMKTSVVVPSKLSLDPIKYLKVSAKLLIDFGEAGQAVLGSIDGKKSVIDISSERKIPLKKVKRILDYLVEDGAISIKRMKREELEEKYGYDAYAIYKKYGEEGLLLYELIGGDLPLKKIFKLTTENKEKFIEMFLFIHDLLKIPVPAEKNLLMKWIE